MSMNLVEKLVQRAIVRSGGTVSKVITTAIFDPRLYHEFGQFSVPIPSNIPKCGTTHTHTPTLYALSGPHLYSTLDDDILLTDVR
eukprot:1022994-Amorphochlora_amoeboformis.AAC.1